MEKDAVKTDKNWNDLPVEMKLECIKRMDFKTRWNLRSTACVEKEIVERTKCREKWTTQVDECEEMFCITMDNFSLVVYKKDEMEAILKMVYINELTVKSYSNLMEFLQEYSQKMPLDVDCLELRLYAKQDLSLVNKCRGLTKLNITCACEMADFSDFLTSCERIFKMECVRLYGITLYEPEDVFKLIDTWIADDKPVGSKFKISYSGSWLEANCLQDMIQAHYETFDGFFLSKPAIFILLGDNKYIAVTSNARTAENTTFRVTNMSSPDVSLV